MDAPEDAVQWTFEQVAERREIATQRIRVGQELGAGGDGAPSARQRHPFTEPWRSAAMTWRWKTMNTRRVGTRMTIVPALSSGMSVA